jgi:hypothetical protein
MSQFTQPQLCTLRDLVNDAIESVTDSIPDLRANGESEEVEKQLGYVFELAGIRGRLDLLLDVAALRVKLGLAESEKGGAA